MLNAARREPARLFIGIDSNLDGLVHASTRAAKKPARGGTPNAWFVHASAEALPCELAGTAERVTVLLPWGGLLRAMLCPDLDVLRGLRSLCRPGADIEVVVSLDAERDRAAEGLAAPSKIQLAMPYTGRRGYGCGASGSWTGMPSRRWGRRGRDGWRTVDRDRRGGWRRRRSSDIQQSLVVHIAGGGQHGGHAR